MGGRNLEEGEAEILQSRGEQQIKQRRVTRCDCIQEAGGAQDFGGKRPKLKEFFSHAPWGPTLSQGILYCQKRS